MLLLTASERKKAGVLLSVMLLIAGLDALGVASILPFMGILANPDLVRTNESLNLVFVTGQKFGIDTDFLVKFENKDNKKNIIEEIISNLEISFVNIYDF